MEVLIDDVAQGLAVDWLVKHLPHAYFDALLDIFVIHKSCDGDDEHLISVGVVAVGVVVAEVLENVLRGLVAIHDGHVEIHEHELIADVAALLDQVLVEHVDCLRTVEGSVHLQAEELLQDQLQRDQVERVVVHYQHRALTSALMCEIIGRVAWVVAHESLTDFFLSILSKQVIHALLVVIIFFVIVIVL